MISQIRIGHGLRLSWIAATAAVAVIVGQMFASWLTLCGTSPDSLAALATGFAVGVMLVQWTVDRIQQNVIHPKHALVASCRVGLIVIALSWTAPTLLNITLLAGCETIRAAWPLSTLLTMLFPALIVAIVTTAAGLFYKTLNPRPEPQWIISLVAGTPGIVVLLIPAMLGLPECPLACWTTLMIGTALVARGVQHTTDHASDHRTDTVDPTISERGQNKVYHVDLPFSAVGILVAAIAEIFCRLMPGSLPVLIQTACITALALTVLSRPLTLRLLTTPAMQLFALLTLASLPVVFVPLTDLNLAINTGSLSPYIVLLVRSVQCAVFATAAFVPAICVLRQDAHSISGRSAILFFVGGVLLALTAVSQNVSPIMLLAAGILIHAVMQAIHSLTDNDWAATADRRSLGRMLTIPVLSLFTPLLAGFGSIGTPETSSILFSERTAAAVQRGVAQELIAQSHANRLIATVLTSYGEVTVWRRTGNVLEFQRNGTPVGCVSTDTVISPQPAEDILPAILPLASHPQPSRVLLLGDDTGVCLRTCTHFPVQEIVAVRSDRRITELAQRFIWNCQPLPADQDQRVHILHEPAMLALRRRELNRFDVVIVSGDSVTLPASASQYTREFYQAARSRMTVNAVFCQRFCQSDPGPEPLKSVMATMMTAFSNVGVVQTMPGEILLLASDSDKGLIDPELLSRLQREHVRREIATAGWDWAQVAILPLLNACDPIGMFSQETPPPPFAVSKGGLAMSFPYEIIRTADRQSELQAAFGPHQQQLMAAVPAAEDHEEVKRRLSALAQQLEILAGMPDEPWTYRKSLQMEMKQSPRPPRDVVENGTITKVAHPLDLLRQSYFATLGKALSAASRGELNTAIISRLDTFTDNFEPLITHFSHYEIVRLHELSQHPSPVDEFRHRLHIVFFTSPVDASVRPVISAMQQLVDQPSLIADDTELYDMLNSLLQKMIERWEAARTAWEPRSAPRVQNDVDLSVGVANRAMALMEEVCNSAAVEKTEFFRRRRFVNAALIKPLRDYRDQVLAHRMKSEKPIEQNSEDPNDVPLLIRSESGLKTN